MKRLRLITLGAITATAAMASIQNESGMSPNCRLRISNYSHVVAVDDGSRFEIRALEACAARLGRPFELKTVTLLVIDRAGAIRYRLSSRTGLLSWDEKRVGLGDDAALTQVRADGKVLATTQVPSVFADWNSRELRSGQGFYARWDSPTPSHRFVR